MTLPTDPLPLEAKPVTLKSSWEDILGAKGEVFTESERRHRWAAWMKLSRHGKRAREIVSIWRDKSGCLDCQHRCGAWCNLAGLPVTINPVLTFRLGHVGMACMGAGFEAKIPPIAPGEQGVLWRESRGLS